DPPLILADEPTGNLDSSSGQVIMNMLDDLRKAGKTILVASHDPRMLNYATHQVYLMDGQMVDKKQYMESISISS
ncbi:MAG: ABC transporter ATP-binding protein, partial [Chloroflexi bacterium]|nr:ABC transporter ATP-binding protein [Chloroflexota bacterium]